MPPALTVALLNTAARSAADLKIAGDPGAGAGGSGDAWPCARTTVGHTLTEASTTMLKAKDFFIGLARRIGVISLLLLAAIAAGQAQPQRTIPPIPEGTSTIGRIVRCGCAWPAAIAASSRSDITPIR